MIHFLYFPAFKLINSVFYHMVRLINTFSHMLLFVFIMNYTFIRYIYKIIRYV